MKKALITGGAGFIGNHLVSYLKGMGYWVRAVDIKSPPFGGTHADDFDWDCDLRDIRNAYRACIPWHGSFDEVYALAADMGGMGFITDPCSRSDILFNNTMINFNTLRAASQATVKRYLFTSSVCVYPTNKLSRVDVAPLREEDVYPALPQETYGWEKLHAEHLCLAYGKEHIIDTRVARLQNTYGPLGAWRGGREKAPAALCRKIAKAKLSGDHQIEIWGDGKATRCFMYVSDCVKGLYTLMESDYSEPVTLGPDRIISINQLADMIARIAGIEIEKVHVEGPQGVRGRNFDHTKIRDLGWEPVVSLEEGMEKTYKWVEQQVMKASS